MKLVSFSVDPDFDRPDVLREYGRTNGADPARWMFLTGTSEAVRGLVRDGFKLPVVEQPDPNMPIVHSQNFMVVDRVGRIRGAFDALTEEGRKELRATLATVVAEPSTKDVYVPADAGDPKWIAERRTAQAAAEKSITAPHNFTFTDRIGSTGITFVDVNSVDIGKYYRATHYDHGTAVAAADVDGDGRLDLYFANQAGKNSLYRNLGGGRFEDITARAGVAVGDRRVASARRLPTSTTTATRICTSLRARGQHPLPERRRRQVHGHHRAGRRRRHQGHSSGAVFFDYDGDGLLDLFVTNVGKYTRTDQPRRPDGLWVSFGDAFAGHLHPERSETSMLYHNLGNGRFEDVTVSSGLVHKAWSGEATPFDYDADGRPDLYVAAMQGHDEVWYNLGGGRFQNRGRQMFPATPWGAMGVKVLDWNGDGQFDLFVTDMHTDMSSDLRPEDERKKHDPKTMFPPRFLAHRRQPHPRQRALHQTGQRPVQGPSDAANAETGWPWGPSAGDLNADGWPDLFVAAGMNYPFRYHGNDVLLNEGGQAFRARGIHPRHRAAPADGQALDHPRLRRRRRHSRHLQGRAGAGDDQRYEERRGARQRRRSSRSRHRLDRPRQPLGRRCSISTAMAISTS